MLGSILYIFIIECDGIIKIIERVLKFNIFTKYKKWRISLIIFISGGSGGDHFYGLSLLKFFQNKKLSLYFKFFKFSAMRKIKVAQKVFSDKFIDVQNYF
jgi:hypothetical protein